MALNKETPQFMEVRQLNNNCPNIQHFDHKLPYLETLGKLNINFNFKFKKKRFIGLATQRSWFTEFILQPLSAIFSYNQVTSPAIPPHPGPIKTYLDLQFDRSGYQSDYPLFSDNAATNFSVCQMVKNDKLFLFYDLVFWF